LTGLDYLLSTTKTNQTEVSGGTLNNKAEVTTLLPGANNTVVLNLGTVDLKEDTADLREDTVDPKEGMVGRKEDTVVLKADMEDLLRVTLSNNNPYVPRSFAISI
jgi:hypothetical protein